MTDTTTVRIGSDTRDDLRALKIGGETYDELFQRLVRNERERLRNAADAGGAATEGENA